MKRDLQTLASREHDLLIVGGGIYGVAAARDAALRGLQVGLIERRDFGAGTSWNSLKTIHGGVRYLQKLDLPRVLDSLAERRRFLRLAPHLVRPLRFALPTRGFGTKSLAGLGAALTIYRMLGARCNRGVAEARHIPRPRLAGSAAIPEVAPGLDLPDAHGVALWWDAQLYSSERIVLEFALAAAERGACLANHVEAADWLEDGDRITGVVAHDRLGQESFEIRARHVLNCAGPDAWSLLDRGPGERAPRAGLSRAGNLVLRRPLFGDTAVALPVRDAVEGQSGEQLLFAAPWRGRTLLGTLHLPLTASGRPELLDSEVERLLAGVNRLCPAANLRMEDVAVVHAGIQTVAGWSEASGQALHSPDPIVYDHEQLHGTRGLHTLVGVKFTEAGGAAQRAVSQVCKRLGQAGAEPGDDGPPLPGGRIEAMPALAKRAAETRLDAAAAEHLLASYGSGAGPLLTLIEEQPALAERIVPDTPVVGASVVHALGHEMAETLADVVLRRTELAARGDLSPEALSRCADLAAETCGWSPAHRDAELRAASAEGELS